MSKNNIESQAKIVNDTRYMSLVDMVELQLELDGDILYENGEPIFVIWDKYMEDSTCIISESFKNKLEETDNTEIRIGDIIEDDDSNKLCVVKILPTEEFDIVLPNCNYQDKLINANLNFHPVTHEPKSLKVKGDK